MDNQSSELVSETPPQSVPPPPPPVKKNSSMHIIFLIILTGIFTALLAGGAVFFLLKNESNKQINELEGSIGTLTQQVSSLDDEKKRLEKEASQATFAKNQAEMKVKEIEQITCKGVWKNGICVKSSCVDSDVNEKPNDMYIKGSVSFTNENGVATVVYDECSGSKQQVNEMWCYESPAGSGNYVQGSLVTSCPKGCFDGACINTPP